MKDSYSVPVSEQAYADVKAMLDRHEQDKSTWGYATRLAEIGKQRKRANIAANYCKRKLKRGKRK